jgi:hypothetical protein
MHRHEQPRRAESTLDGPSLDERFSYSLKERISLQPFKRRHGTALDLCGGQQATVVGRAIHEHGAAPAATLCAANFCSEEAEFVSQDIGQRQRTIQIHRYSLMVEREAELHSTLPAPDYNGGRKRVEELNGLVTRVVHAVTDPWWYEYERAWLNGQYLALTLNVTPTVHHIERFFL